MRSPPLHRTRCPLAAGLLVCLAPLPAHAWFRFNEGRDQVYVTTYIGTGYDSNVFANKNASGDLVINGGAGMEYTRKSGLIGVNASLGWDFGNFASYSSEDFLNPSAALELSKGTGRTTGALQLNASRASRADPTVGLRTDSWNYGANLNYRYPIMDRYSLSGNIGWDRIDYQDAGATLVDLDAYTIGTDLFYSWRSDRDLLAGYRYRLSESSATSQGRDDSIYLGISGRILSKLSGTARVGWTFHKNTYPRDTTLPDLLTRVNEDTSDGLYVDLSSTWPVTKKASFLLSLGQDFSTSSTNFQTETSTVNLEGKFSHTVKFSTSAHAGAGYTQYISGFVNNTPVFTPGFRGGTREDYYVTAGTGASYVLNNHLTLSANYTYYENCSNLPTFTFVRHSVGLTVSTRW
jgi:hypothetical protein